MNKLKLNKYIKGLLLIALIFLFIGIKPLSAYQETEKIRVYRVQFAASKTFIEPSYFQKKFNLDREIHYFEKDGWYKYYVGEFDTEAEAFAYYHETGDVGYVISSMVEVPIEPVSADSLINEVTEDSLQAGLEGDTISFTEEKPDSESDSAVSTLEEPGLKKERGSLKWLNVFLVAMAIFFAVLLITWFIYSRKRKKTKPSDSESNEESIIEEDDPLLKGPEPFAFLDQSDKNLSGWEQLRVLEAIREKNIDPPDFSFWLDSENSSIVAFCLRMIRSLDQKDAFKAVLRLLDHHNDEIRAESIVTLGDLGNRDALELFREKYPDETFTNRMLILRAMARIPDESSIDFLKELLRVPGNFQIEAAHALASIKSFGIRGVENAMKELGFDSETIARHILINKL